MGRNKETVYSEIPEFTVRRLKKSQLVADANEMTEQTTQASPCFPI
jgi:hypothetical protein